MSIAESASVDTENSKWDYISRGPVMPHSKDHTAGCRVDLSKAELREISQTRTVDFIKNSIVSMTLLAVLCGASFVMLSQYGESQGILPLNTYHIQSYNSYFGGLIRFVKADHNVVYEYFPSDFVSETCLKFFDCMGQFQDWIGEEISRVRS